MGGIDPSGGYPLKLPNDPSGLPPGWKPDPSHGGPNGEGSERYISPSGNSGLDFDPAVPSAEGERAHNHWYDLVWGAEDGIEKNLKTT